VEGNYASTICDTPTPHCHGGPVRTFAWLQKATGHASITVTAHTYADLFDDELDNIAVALDSLSDF
jgi:hypothetical protein